MGTDPNGEMGTDPIFLILIWKQKMGTVPIFLICDSKKRGQSPFFSFSFAGDFADVASAHDIQCIHVYHRQRRTP
jgi:hypothetical protein